MDVLKYYSPVDRGDRPDIRFRPKNLHVSYKGGFTRHESEVWFNTRDLIMVKVVEQQEIYLYTEKECVGWFGRTNKYWSYDKIGYKKLYIFLTIRGTLLGLDFNPFEQ